MKEVTEFLHEWFDLEQHAKLASDYKSRHNKYNKIANKMAAKTLHMAGTGFPIRERPAPNFMYDECIEVLNIRRVYKSSSYDNAKYGVLWVCYTSALDPSENINII